MCVLGGGGGGQQQEGVHSWCGRLSKFSVFFRLQIFCVFETNSHIISSTHGKVRDTAVQRLSV